MTKPLVTLPLSYILKVTANARLPASCILTIKALPIGWPKLRPNCLAKLLTKALPLMSRPRNSLPLSRKKQQVYVVIGLARKSRLIVSCAVMTQRSPQAMQEFADQLPTARRYCSDGLATTLSWSTPKAGSTWLEVSKAQTHTVECMNANLRPYLGRLKRRSRCFSREPRKLWQVVRLFVWHHNRRQRAILANPKLKNALTLVF